jgi:O-antigen ligase
MSLALRSGVSAPWRNGGWDGGIVALTVFAAPLLSIFAPLGMAPLFGAGAFALLARDMIRSRGWPQATILAFRRSRPLRQFGLLSVLLCFWALASAAWSLEPAQALVATGQVFSLVCAAGVHLAAAGRLRGETRRFIGRALLAGILVGVALLAVEIFDGGWFARHLHDLSDIGPDQTFSRYNRGLTVLLLLAFPALLALAGGTKRVALGLVVGALVMLYYGSSLQLAVCAALLAVLLALALPRAAPWIVGGAMALFIAAVPLLPPLTVKTVDTDGLTARTHNVSIAHRIIIWRFSADRIADKPLAGWGMNAARAMPGGKEKVVLLPGPPPVMGEQLPLHTHNAPLQWWLELGLPGAALMAGLWLFALRMIARHTPARVPRAIAIGGFAAGFVIANLSFGAWQAWWLATLGLTAALTLLFLPAPRDAAA